MATQAALIAETIAGMKRVISNRQYSSDSDDSVQRPTNRGYKLKRKAQFIHEGQLDLPNGPKVYKRKIEHAGYERYVLSRNPKRYDEYGDELEDDEVDEQADAAAVEANPYGEIKLEHLLAPLAAAADLPNHPSLATPYTSSVLSGMVQQACEMVHKERKTLWDIKHLLTKFRGDQTWIPVESMISDHEAALFSTTPLLDDPLNYPELKVNGDDPYHSHERHKVQYQVADTGTGRVDRGSERERLDTGPQASPRLQIASAEGEDDVGDAANHKELDIPINDGIGLEVDMRAPGDKEDNADTAMADTEVREGPQAEIEPYQQTATGDIVSDVDFTQSKSTTDATTSKEPHVNGATTSTVAKTSGVAIEIEVVATTGQEGKSKDGVTDDSILHQVSVEEDQVEEIQPAAHRMTTRARAQAASSKTTSSHTQSPSPSSSISPFIHPLYLVPPSALPDRDFGLPPAEAEETRRTLMLWVQKQEEVCRGVEKLYEGLLRADRMRKTVLSWCKAEGHVGEMSDGEDWYDKEEWALDEDLKKGHEDEDDDAGNQGKKTRGRRA